MRHFLILLCTVLTYSAGAATSGPLLLKGVVPKSFSLVLNAESIAANLPLDTSQNNTKVAGLELSSNSSNGYRITITSANGGKLVHQRVSSSTMPYTLKYDTQSVNLSSSQTLTFAAPGRINKIAPVQVSYTGVPYESLYQGDYTDTVTFTISSI